MSNTPRPIVAPVTPAAALDRTEAPSAKPGPSPSQSAAGQALDAIDHLCGYECGWDYPGQVVRSVRGALAKREQQRDEARQTVRRMADEAAQLRLEVKARQTRLKELEVWHGAYQRAASTVAWLEPVVAPVVPIYLGITAIVLPLAVSQAATPLREWAGDAWPVVIGAWLLALGASSLMSADCLLRSCRSLVLWARAQGDRATEVDDG